MTGLRLDLIDIPRIPEERARRYREAGLWRSETLDEMILTRASATPDRCALVAEGRRTTYGELAALVGRAERRLRAAGVNRGDTVVVQVPNSREYVVLVLALMRLGAPPVLTLPSLREYELDRIIGLVRPSSIVIPRRVRRFDHLGMVQKLKPRHPYLVRTLVVDGEAAEPDVADLTGLCDPPGDDPPAEGRGAASPKDVALFLLSSGTTGSSKLIARTHEDYGYVIRTTTEIAALSADSVYLAVMPATHTFVLAYPGVLGTLAAGGTVVLGSPEDPRKVLRTVQEERVTHCAAVPGLVKQWLTLLEQEPYDVSSLKVLQVGGARLDAPTAARAKAELGCSVQQVYGMSEGLTNYTRLDDPDEVVFSSQGRPASPADEIVIVDEDDAPVPAGEVGQLLTRGPFTVAGYYRDEAATKRAFTADGFYRTGDLVRLRPDGNLEVVGRIKNVINRGGEKICAEELEELVQELPGVSAVAAVPMPHPGFGEIVCLYLVPGGENAPDLGDVRRHLESRGLARYKLPERLELLDAMPLIGVGKINRTELRERAAALAAGVG